MKIIIVGAGGHARVVHEILSYDKNMEIVAFIDNVVRGTDETIIKVPVLGGHSVIPKLVEEGVKGFIIAIGDNQIRKQYYEQLLEMDLEPINAVHPTANIARNSKLGKGVVIAIGSTIVTGSYIGDNSIINTGSIVEHEDQVGKNAHISPGSSLAGRVVIKDGATIGAGCVITPYLTIGENSTIGAGSVVLENIPDNCVAVGSPAKVIKINNKRV